MQIVAVSWPDTVDLRRNVLGWSEHPVNGDQEPETTHLAAVDQHDHPIGVVSMVSLPCPEYPEQPGTYFWAMAVARPHQGRGIGRSLITEVIDRAQSAGAEVMWADARSSAIPFYERCGAFAVGPSYTDDITGLIDRRVIFTLAPAAP